MRRALYILTILSLFGFSFKNRNTGRLTGTIANCKDSTVLYLVDLDSLNTVDSLIVVNGTFTHNLQLAHPTKFLLHNKRNQYGFRDRKLIWLERRLLRICNSRLTGSGFLITYRLPFYVMEGSIGQ